MNKVALVGAAWLIIAAGWYHLNGGRLRVAARILVGMAMVLALVSYVILRFS